MNASDIEAIPAMMTSSPLTAQQQHTSATTSSANPSTQKSPQLSELLAKKDQPSEDRSASRDKMLLSKRICHICRTNLAQIVHLPCSHLNQCISCFLSTVAVKRESMCLLCNTKTQGYVTVTN